MPKALVVMQELGLGLERWVLLELLGKLSACSGPSKPSQLVLIGCWIQEVS